MKKTLSILLAASMLCALCSCGGAKVAKTSQSGSMTIDWVPQNDSPVDNNSPVIAELEERLDADFNFIYMDRNQAEELMNVRIAGGEIPDAFTVNDSTYRNYIDQNVLSEIPEQLIKEVAPTLYEKTKEYGGDDIFELAKQDGKLYGIPLLSPNGRYHFVPIWRDDWLKNVGIDKIPETLDEAEDAFYKFVNNDPDGNGKKDTYAMSSHGINAIFNAYGADPLQYYWTERDGEIVSSAVLPEMKDALTRLNKWYKDGLIDPEFITGENKGQYWANTPGFANGLLGFSMPGMYYHVQPPLGGANAGSVYTTFHDIQGDDASFAVGTPLIGPNGTQGATHWGVFAADYFVMGKNVGTDTEKMRKILEVIETLNSDFDTYILARYGREGTDYKQENGVYTSLIDDPQKRQSLGLYANGLVRVPNNLDFTYRCDPQEVRDFAEKYANITDNYSNAVWGGLPSDNIYKAVVEQKITENYYAFITGARNIDEFDAFVAELNKAGLEQLTTEANQWYKERYK